MLRDLSQTQGQLHIKPPQDVHSPTYKEPAVPMNIVTLEMTWTREDAHQRQYERSLSWQQESKNWSEGSRLGKMRRARTQVSKAQDTRAVWFTERHN